MDNFMLYYHVISILFRNTLNPYLLLQIFSLPIAVSSKTRTPLQFALRLLSESAKLTLTLAGQNPHLLLHRPSWKIQLLQRLINNTTITKDLHAVKPQRIVWQESWEIWSLELMMEMSHLLRLTRWLSVEEISWLGKNYYYMWHIVLGLD